MSGYSICFNKKNGFFNAINKQATNGQKDDQLRYLQNMCSFCARTVANLIHLIRQVAALRHVKN